MPAGGFLSGLGYLGEGFRLIRQPGLRLFVVIPLVLNILLFGIFFLFLAEIFGAMIAAAMGWLPDWAWLQSLDWLFWILYGVVILLMLAYGFVIVANLIGSPFYGYLSELTEKHLTGQVVVSDGGWAQIIRDIPRSLWREVQKIAYYLPRALGLLILGLIPVVNLVAAVLWFGFNSWMMALQYVDYPADNHRLSFPGLKQRLRRNRPAALGFGLPIALASMVPVLNLVVVPAAVCGATAYWVREAEASATP
ncbi:sulfate transporter CysZ [Marinobacter salicampi]|uniref:sulfate transporter CysZ n=1 Tax=Marinobacter salicampi TaxID=435907 RepID=UPI001409EC25|nr:sulfate transporter CysZ [Marinobacter salicampi]